MKATDVFIWGIVIGIVLMMFISRKYKRFKTQKMLQRAKSAEKKAVILLQKWGYTVLDVQLKEKVTITIDGKPHDSTVRADLLVRKGFKRYIVEVKTGGQTSATLPNVRRQLLEYNLIYQPDGMFLLDMEKEVLKEIKFTSVLPKQQLGRSVLLLLAGALLCYVTLRVSGQMG